MNFARGTWRIPRSRGALSGLLLMALGAWGALIPFIGPAFDFGFGGTQSWNWTAARFWLEVLPGIATFVGGLLLAASGNRGTAMIGSWLAIAAGAWFIIGPTLAGPWNLGDLGTPLGADGGPATAGRAAVTWLLLFYALGAVILYLGSTAQGRLSVRSLRDIEYAQMRAQHKMLMRGERGGAFGGMFGGGRGRREEPAHVGGGDRDYRDERTTPSGRDEPAVRADRPADRDVYPSDTRTEQIDRAEPTTRGGATTAGGPTAGGPTAGGTTAGGAERGTGHDVYPSDTARAGDTERGRHEAHHEGLGEKINRTLARHGIGGRH